MIYVFIAVVVIALFAGVPIFEFVKRKKSEEKEENEKKQQLDAFNNSEYAKQTGDSYYFTMQDKGDFFEYETSLILQSKGKLLVKLLIPYPKRPGKEDISDAEIDSVLINNYGVFVLECKNWSGNVFADDFDQSQVIIEYNRETERRLNPVNQNDQHIRAIKKYISDDAPIYSLIVYNDITCKMINIATDTPHRKVLPISQLKDYLDSFNGKMEVIDDASVDNIYLNLQKFISTRQQREEHKKQVKINHPD